MFLDPFTNETIDFVGPSASEKYIPHKYSLIVSSHVVEHQIDLLKHFQDISGLLIPGGIYIALIPDLRYCFDHFQNPSTFVEVMVAHFDKQSNNSLKNFLDDRLLTSHNMTIDYWRNIAGQQKLELLGVNAIYAYVNEYLNAREYLDVHAWKFTPRSFHSIVDTLSRLKLINLELKQIAATFPGNNEFWVVFER